MHYLYLVSTVFLVSTSSIFGGFYNRKNAGKRDPSPLYNLILCSSAFVGWVILYLAFTPTFDIRVLPYSIGFGIGYALCQIGLINALRTGPIPLTNLFLQLALIATTVWGFFFWNTQFSLLKGIALVLVVISLWLCLYNGKTSKEGKDKVSLKWLFFALMAFVSNSCCAIIQKTQQLKFDGKHGNFMMMCAVFFSAVFCLIVYLKSDKKDSREIFKTSFGFPMASGLCNVVHNLIVIILATSTIPSSLVYPVIAVGGLSVTSLFSLIVFKEKLKSWQWIGIAVGALAVVLLSI